MTDTFKNFWTAGRTVSLRSLLVSDVPENLTFFTVLYKDRLLRMGTRPNQIIEVALDDIAGARYRNPLELYEFVRGRVENGDTHYVFLDEIQLLGGNFVELVNGLMHLPNVDVYVTGSNSRFLSTDIATEFRGRGDEIRVFPFSFREFVAAYDDVEQAWQDYYTYGGLPLILSRRTDELKAEYLISLFDNIYINDIKERHALRTDAELDTLVDILASGVGGLTSPHRLSNAFKSAHRALSDKTINVYLDYLTDAFLIEKAVRFDVKGKKYISTPAKYYFEDIGLRNARLNFRQQEPSHIMENIVFNELRSRGFRVDVGVVDVFESSGAETRSHRQLEVDFVANKGNQKYYIQSALEIAAPEKEAQEKKSLKSIKDSFQKIIVTGENVKQYVDENGIVTLSLRDFLLNESILGGL